MSVLIGSFATLFVVIVALLFAVGYSLNRTLGWFAANKEVTADNMSAIVYQSEFFDIYVSPANRTTFAQNSAELSVLQGDKDDWQIDITSKSATGILCYMTNEAPAEEDDDGIFPGSYGTITFDVVPKVEMSGVQFKISYFGLQESGSTYIEISEDSDVSKLMSGHVLLFENRESIKNDNNGPYFYSNRVDGEYTLNFGAAPDSTDEYGDHYTVTLYWVWPATIGQMIFEDGNVHLHSHSIFSPTNTADVAEINSYISAHNDHFLSNSSVQFNGTSDPYFDAYYSEFGNGYNDGDQAIGDTVRYFAIEFEGTAINS